MNMTQIKYVLAIAREGSMHKAAQSLYVSQPNLSSAIKQLEKELGFPLFTRTGSGMQLTAAGHEICTFAQAVYKQYQLLDNFCLSLNSAPAEHLSIAAQYSEFANDQFVQWCLAPSANSYHYAFYQDSFRSVVDLVCRQTAEIGIVTLTAHQRQIALSHFKKNALTYHTLAKCRQGVVLRRGHPLTRDPSAGISPEELSDYPFVTNTDINYSFASAVGDVTFAPPSKTIRVNDFHTLYRLLSATNAYTTSIFPETAPLHEETFETHPLLSEAADAEIGFICSRDYQPSHAAASYIEGLRCRLPGAAD